jgi:hypothetical protein
LSFVEKTKSSGGTTSLITADASTILLLVWCFLLGTCASLILVSESAAREFHIDFNQGQALFALAPIVALGALSCVAFSMSRFSFGYFSSFYFLSVIASYLWLSYFTPLKYDHVTARISIAASYVAFLLPALTITRAPIRMRTLSEGQVDILAKILLGAVLGIVAYAAQFGFRLASPTNEEIRSSLNNPVWINYLISISTATILPFIFAWFHQRQSWTLMGMSLIAGLLLYPVFLNKTTFLTPFWLLALAVLLRFAKVRIAVILTLLVPMLVGFIAFGLEPSNKKPIVGLLNFRLLAIPGSALDHYYHYFSTHPLTHFCQVTFIGKLFQCSLPDQLGVVLEDTYGLGSYPASLFATEGIASVGVLFAPVAAFVCGLVIAVGNIASSGLRPSFVFLSSATLVQVLMNVPLSVVMVTHGGLLMFLLWAVTPKSKNFSDEGPGTGVSQKTLFRKAPTSITNERPVRTSARSEL